MKPQLTAALLATFLSFALLGNACTRHVIATTFQSQPTLYGLGDDAQPDDRFCVYNKPGPDFLPTETGVHCTSVLAVKKFVASIRLADDH